MGSKASAFSWRAVSGWLAATALLALVAILAVVPIHTKTVTVTKTKTVTKTVTRPVTYRTGTAWLLSLPIAGSFPMTLGDAGKADCVGTQVINRKVVFIACYLKHATP